MTKFYVASKTHHAKLWQSIRQDYNIISTWIDEAGPNETGNMQELWTRILNEVKACDVLVFYIGSADYLLKGAFVEVGMALALDKQVRVVLGNGVELDSGYRPVGSWVNHLNVTIFKDFKHAFNVALT